MRDTLVIDIEYFEEYLLKMESLIQESNDRITNGSLSDENISGAKYRYFLKFLERLIANYSKGESIDLVKQQYTTALNMMNKGWDDSVVKFKMGRPPVIYDKYMLNEYCYMIWMLSLAILLKVPEKELNILKSIIEKGKIDDELIQFLLHLNAGKTSETIYKPFKSLLKKDIQKTDSNHIKKYLDKWYQNTKLLTWHNYNPKGGKYFYYGRWSFESAVIVAILDLDDSKFRENEYYPKDLVDYYRANHPA